MKLTIYLHQQKRGAVKALANQIGANSSDISFWSSGARPVPVRSAVAIEKATNGAVTRRDLRPQDWHLIWPELAEKFPSYEG